MQIPCSRPTPANRANTRGPVQYYAKRQRKTQSVNRRQWHGSVCSCWEIFVREERQTKRNGERPGPTEFNGDGRMVRNWSTGLASVEASERRFDQEEVNTAITTHDGRAF